VETHNIILHGGGEHARVVLDCALAQGHRVVSIYDPKYSEGELLGVPYRGPYSTQSDPGAYAIVAIGDNSARKKVAESTSHLFTNVIHPSSLISTYAQVEKGNMLLHGSIVQAGSHIFNHVIVNTGTQVDHDCVIENYVHIGPGVILCGNVQVGEGTFLGAGAIVIPGKKIGAWAIIGAGAVVVGDIPDYAVVVGNPGRIIKYINQ
jgi:sugar O-acyltransferase (sialic acid O-acetyltransferase NeuD family)